ncbi:MAG: ribonuclease Z, partial [Myxococcales bacterium]|nr:ribonuclease Z [Myxococcales bacterium]
MAKLTFIGTGEAFDPELPNTSVLYTGSKNILVDCGFSVPHAFWRITHDPNLLDAIYITHIHADHTFGLPALLLWMRIAGRTRPLRIFGGSGVGTWLSRLLALAYPGAYEPNKCFPIEPVPIRPRIGFVWDDLMI